MSLDSRRRFESSEMLRLREKMVLLAMAGASGAAVVAHAFFPVPMKFTVPFLVLPLGLLLVGTVLWRRSDRRGLRLVGERVARGAKWGFVATIVYDIVRPPLGVWFSFGFKPYQAMPIFGDLITGRGTDDLLAQTIGWGYHFWNGVGFGIMFALVLPRAGRWPGTIWGLLLQAVMMATYPSFLGARLDDPGFLVTGIVGHSLWGFVLGWGLEFERRRAADAVVTAERPPGAR